ncbi:hypothetical protein [Ideonella alba]|uniref:CBS domain-containing protein n=1 Tax=Ideonella alba TaxID=2824118 RepID=A0A941BKK1_9BURK|nr:hypothetical protein [Ideonella alba]MBQ0930214.1 hypothetical protein [Ideonella alba]
MIARSFLPLPLGSLTTTPRLVRPLRQARVDDPARAFMSDLLTGPCLTADHLDGIDATLALLHAARVQMAWVSGIDGELVGYVTRDDLLGERPLQAAMADGVPHQDLRLERLMTPLSQWQVIDARQLDSARVGDIVATMHAQSLRYLPVVRRNGAGEVLVGLFSARLLEQALGTTIAPDLHARNVAELGRQLAA